MALLIVYVYPLLFCCPIFILGIKFQKPLLTLTGLKANPETKRLLFKGNSRITMITIIFRKRYGSNTQTVMEWGQYIFQYICLVG